MSFLLPLLAPLVGQGIEWLSDLWTQDEDEYYDEEEYQGNYYDEYEEDDYYG